MDNSLKLCIWEEVNGLCLINEYSRFVKYIEAQLAQGQTEEQTADPNYGAGEIYGGRWFKDIYSGQIWRLVAPDFPFKGLW
ncbi:MAG: hypothetical protein Q8N35_05435 [Methylococcaceae bacterium]|nr:hypothetical protein [Methylococcaceae bacterium]MDZ4155901.1 hypothetical protein [Methylococcales bacterium]MDP2392278.1 hypothetical protein [Methylococcaceae bacterium]MDP3019010.1 hypothetical protein [Methylococcaceae bacterium]MDP3391572.1 hypothetical protein [Methylococcaceae bacterium]